MMIYKAIYFPVDTFSARGLQLCDCGTMLELRVGSLETFFLNFRPDRNVLFECTCRGMSYQQKMIYAVLARSAILPEVVA
jgi:hypothetical protein